ncbi:restriction endonuclease subunit S [Streptomyces sp. NPDC004031]
MATVTAGWSRSRLKYLARLDYGLGQPPRLNESGVPILRATNINRGKITPAGLIYAAKSDLPLDRVPLLRAGEILVVRSGAYTGDSALVTDDWVGSAPGYDLRVTPKGVVPRYLAYCLLGSAVMQQIDISKNRAAQPHLNAEELGEVVVDFPEVSEQRRIADFLDAETVRIDKLVALRLRQRDAIRTRQSMHTERCLAECSSGEWTRVKYLLRVRPRYGVLVPAFEDEGIPFIRVNDLLDLPGRASGLAKISAELSNQYARTIARSGDVLVSVVGTLGRAAVLPEELVGANIARAVCSIRLQPKANSGLFAAWIGTSEFERQALLATGTDSAQPTLGMEDLSNFAIRWPTDPREQDLVASRVREGQGVHADLVQRTDRQLALLAERRQALITAAVTGQVDVTTARPTYDRDL